MKRVLLLFLLALLVLAPACGQTAETSLAGHVQVVRVIDGDTIVISGDLKVRYIGIDTPEKDKPFFREATEANRELVQGKELRLVRDVSDKDRYDRLLRYVYADSIFVNLELVKEGWAEAKEYPPDTLHRNEFEAAEREAKAARRGIWSRR
ncbi:MAG: thermonuclease family protein [Chloroflexi bacterium]|nr:thermonuclease family protein [Chloroflexota bacterium]